MRRMRFFSANERSEEGGKEKEEEAKEKGKGNISDFPFSFPFPSSSIPFPSPSGLSYWSLAYLALKYGAAASQVLVLSLTSRKKRRDPSTYDQSHDQPKISRSSGSFSRFPAGSNKHDVFFSVIYRHSWQALEQKNLLSNLFRGPLHCVFEEENDQFFLDIKWECWTQRELSIYHIEHTTHWVGSASAVSCKVCNRQVNCMTLH